MKFLTVKKKFVVAILSAFFAVCAFMGLTSLEKVSAEENLEPVTLSTTMESGAAMRLTEPTGMRFIANVKTGDLEKFDDNVKVVVMITQKNLLDEAGISVENFNKDSEVAMGKVTFKANEFPEAVNGEIRLVATILEVADANIAKTYVAKTYITDGKKIGYVEQASSSSIWHIANMSLEEFDPVEDAEEYAVLLRYSKSCTITIEGEEAQTVPYGVKLSEVFADMPKCHSFTSIKDANNNDIAFDSIVTSNLTIVRAINHVYVNGECECGHKANVENYGGKVYIQADGKIEGLTAQSVSINGKTAAVENGVANAEELAVALAGVELGDDVAVYVAQGNDSFLKATAKYVTLAISDYNELTQMKYYVADYYVLTNDIDCAGGKWENVTNGGFSATLDGQGYAIRNLMLYNPTGSYYEGFSGTYFSSDSSWKCKFITRLNKEGVVKNLVIDGVKSDGTIGKTALIGENFGTVENVVVSFATPDVDGFCGLVGENAGTIKNCVLDYSAQQKWVWAYICKTNSGTVENVLVNKSYEEVSTGNDRLLIADGSGTYENCQKVSVDKKGMLALISDATLQALYNKISINALSKGTKADIDFNGKTVSGYIVNMDYATTFQITQNYIDDLKMRDIVAVKVWAKCDGYLYIPERTPGSLYSACDRTEWMNYQEWTPINIGRNYYPGFALDTKSWNFSNDVITPDQLALFDIGCAVDGNSNVYVYIEEFTAETVPVISGKNYTTRTETIGGQEVTVYRVDLNSNNNEIDPNNAISGFMLSRGYLDKLASEGYTSISFMMKANGLVSTAKGYFINADDYRGDWRTSINESDWTQIDNPVTGVAYTLEEAMHLHIQGLEGGGFSYPTYIEFYIVANK